jgi:hypothetical protein
MIPEEPVQLADGFADVYLIEARSIGGLSGSPVFIRRTIAIAGQVKESGESGQLHGLGGTMYLLGLMHGHWDIKESEINKPSASSYSQHGVNMGIAIVIPADKIIETISHPELKALREASEAVFRQSRMPTPDTSSS